MKRILLPLMAMSIALTSCSRDNDDVTNPIVNPVAQAKKLVGISGTVIHTPPGGVIYPADITIEYNGDFLKKMGGVFGGVDLLYHYNGDKISSIEVANRGLPDPQYAEFTYNPNGTLKSAKEVKSNGYSSYEITREYEYINNSTIKMTLKSVSTHNGSTGSTGYSYYTLTMNNGKLVKWESFDESGNILERHQYRYDDKKNPMNEIKGFAALAVDIEFGRYIGWSTTISAEYHKNQVRAFKNNVVSQTIEYLNYNIHSEEYEHQYQYNQDNYPTKSILIMNSFGTGHNGSDEQSKYEFIYNYQ